MSSHIGNDSVTGVSRAMGLAVTNSVTMVHAVVVGDVGVHLAAGAVRISLVVDLDSSLYLRNVVDSILKDALGNLGCHLSHFFLSLYYYPSR